MTDEQDPIRTASEVLRTRAEGLSPENRLAVQKLAGILGILAASPPVEWPAVLSKRDPGDIPTAIKQAAEFLGDGLYDADGGTVLLSLSAIENAIDRQTRALERIAELAFNLVSPGSVGLLDKDHGDNWCVYRQPEGE